MHNINILFNINNKISERRIQNFFMHHKICTRKKEQKILKLSFYISGMFCTHDKVKLIMYLTVCLCERKYCSAHFD